MLDHNDTRQNLCHSDAKADANVQVLFAESSPIRAIPLPETTGHFMESNSEHSLPAIPEAAAISHVSNSARSSPRSTSDNPARSLQPISQYSRLLQPTLSWQAKAGYIPELMDAPKTSEAESAQNTTAADAFAAAVNARDQALAAGRRTSLVSPKSSIKDREADTKDASGESLLL